MSHQVPPDTALVAERAFDKDQPLHLPYPVSNDTKRLPYTILHDGCLGQAGRLGGDTSARLRSILLFPYERQRSQVYALDCEMARRHFSTMIPTQPDTVSDRGRQGTETGLHDRLWVRHRRVRKLVKPPDPIIDYLTT